MEIWGGRKSEMPSMTLIQSRHIISFVIHFLEASKSVGRGRRGGGGQHFAQPEIYTTDHSTKQDLDVTWMIYLFNNMFSPYIDEYFTYSLLPDGYNGLLRLLFNAFNRRSEPHTVGIGVISTLNQVPMYIASILDRRTNTPISSSLAYPDTSGTIGKISCQTGLVYSVELKKE